MSLSADAPVEHETPSTERAIVIAAIGAGAVIAGIGKIAGVTATAVGTNGAIADIPTVRQPAR